MNAPQSQCRKRAQCSTLRGAWTSARASVAGRWCHLAAVQISTVEYFVTCIGLHVQNTIAILLTVTLTLAAAVLCFSFEL